MTNLFGRRRRSPKPEDWAHTPRSPPMSSASPNDRYGHKMSPGDYNSGQSDSARSPVSSALSLLKSITEKKPTRVDGQEPKRRGPKPDSKPATTRRQELNRQAQRTHRERKELYTKSLEEQVITLREKFSMMARDMETLEEENRQLKALLARHNVKWSGTGGVDEFTNSSVGYTSSGSISGSYAPGSQTASPPDHNYSSPSNSANGRSIAAQQVQSGVDYDQTGIDFVLTYGNPAKSYLTPPHK